MAQPNDSLRLLEADLQALSLQASRVEGGVFGGLFSSGSGPLDPDVRDAAEHALARLRAGAAVASEPSEEKASMTATAPALRAALSACASPRPDVALAGLRCAQRLVAIGAALASDDLCALADALGADEADETEDDDERFDAVATRKAQTLLQVLELDACFRDERVARRVLAACFRVLAAANARALRETHESASRRVVAAEAAAFRACERAFAAASFGDDDAEGDDGNDDGFGGTTTRVPIQTTENSREGREAFVTTERRVAFDVFCELCDAAAGDAAAGDADRTPPRFAFDALTRALLVEPRARNAVRGFETAGGAFGVAAIKTRLCAALVTKTFTDAMASPGRSARRRDSAAFVAERRAATRCAGAFLRFAAPRRRDPLSRGRARTRDGVAERAERVADSSAESPRVESSFFAFLSPSRLGRDAEEEDERSPNPRESVEFARRTESSAPNDENEKESDFVDPFAAERLMFLGSFASSLEGEMAPWRRSAALDVLRTVAGDPELLRHARGDGAGTGNASDAFGEVTDILARVAEAGVSVPRGDGDDAFRDGDTSEVTDADDAVPLRVASAFRDAANAARNASKFREPEDSDETGHVAHAVFLALDGVLATCSSLETLADESVFLKDESYKTDVRLMVERAWVSLESCLCTAFRRVPGEAATLELSRAYQALTRAAAAAGAREAADACLASLCAFSVSDSDRFAFETKRERDHKSKSAHAFRALLNAAQSLVAADGGLGFRGWFAVLETTRLVEARRALAGERTMTTTETNSDDATVDALLASAAALVASSAALRDDQSADALEAARGSSARELEELSGRFQSISAPKATNVPADARAVPVRSDLRALARFVDAVLLRVRGETLDAPSRATAAAAAWHTLEAHFRDALESAAQSPEIARRACAHLERAVVGALEAIAAGKRFDDASSLDAAGVLAPLARAKARARDLPARIQAVEAISALVRERGDLLAAAAGWAAAFDALRAGDFVETQDLAGPLGAERETCVTKESERRRKDDAAVVVAGWSAAAFVVSDALPLLSLGAPGNEEARDGVRDGADALALARVVPLLSSYASQTDDTRVSLSAVNAMWNACDVFARRAEDMGFRDGGDREGTRPDSLDALLLRAFEALAAAGVDRSRPDVRHSGVNTLANVLATRGAALSPAAWRDATLGVFFPLVFEIRARAAAAGDERVDVSMVSALASNGTSRLASVVASSTEDSLQTDPSDPSDAPPVLLVHHSRNTAAKQWDETLSVAITAVGELARKRAARLLARETRDAFVGPVWTRTCAFAAECVTSASQETATAALRAARLAATRFASVSVEGEGPDEPPRDASVRAAARAAFKAALRGVYETATRLATRDPDAKKKTKTKVTAKTRLELAKTLAQVFAAVPASAFDLDDVTVVVSVADALVRAPEPWPEWFEEEEVFEEPSTPKRETRRRALRALGSGYAASQTQRACFDALAALVPNVDDKCVDAGTYVTVLFCFLAYVNGGSNVSSNPEITSSTEITPTQPSSIGMAENATCAALACDVFAKLASVTGLPGDDLACVFAGAVSTFARAMTPITSPSREEEEEEEEAFQLRVAATRAFHATLDRGVPAAQKYVSAAGGADVVRRSWGIIADAFEASIFHRNLPEGTEKGPAVQKRKRRREEDALRREGLAALRDACARGDSAPEDVIARLVQVLAAGADAEIGHETSSAVRVEEGSSSAAASDAATETSVARSFAERAFPSLCLLHLRDLVLSAGAGPGASSAARLAAPALLAKCESSLRRYAAEESLRREGSAEGFETAVSAARAAVAARALASALAPAPGGGPGGGFFFRKETPATILAAAATPERARALRAALEACVEASDAALRDAAGTTLAALSRFQESRA
jgi:hypothetical protein